MWPVVVLARNPNSVLQKRSTPNQPRRVRAPPRSTQGKVIRLRSGDAGFSYQTVRNNIRTRVTAEQDARARAGYEDPEWEMPSIGE